MKQSNNREAKIYLQENENENKPAAKISLQEFKFKNCCLKSPEKKAKQDDDWISQMFKGSCCLHNWKISSFSSSLKEKEIKIKRSLRRKS